jgi:hypothetical protein
MCRTCSAGAVVCGLSPAGHTRAQRKTERAGPQLGRSLLGRGVSLTKQESQTRVPSFRVKSTRRLESIAAPHFPQTSLGVSLIGFHLFYRTTMRLCLVLPSRGCLLRRSYRIDAEQGIESGIAIVAPVHADLHGAQRIFLDGAAPMRTGDFDTAAVRASISACDGDWRRGGAAWLLRK